MLSVTATIGYMVWSTEDITKEDELERGYAVLALFPTDAGQQGSDMAWGRIRTDLQLGATCSTISQSTDTVHYRVSGKDGSDEWSYDIGCASITQESFVLDLPEDARLSTYSEGLS